MNQWKCRACGLMNSMRNDKCGQCLRIETWVGDSADFKPMSGSKFPPQVGIFWDKGICQVMWTKGTTIEAPYSSDKVLPYTSNRENAAILTALQEENERLRSLLDRYGLFVGAANKSAFVVEAPLLKNNCAWALPTNIFEGLLNTFKEAEALKPQGER